MKYSYKTPNKQQHCYLASYKAGVNIGHVHLYCDAPLTPPGDTVDMIENIAEQIGCNSGEVIITSIFYFGFIFPQAVIEDEPEQEEPEVKQKSWKDTTYCRVDVVNRKCKHGISIDEPCRDCYETIPF